MRFSVIIPTLNEEKFLPRLLDSLEAQTDRDFEVIVVDGNSKDKTIVEAKKYANILPALKIIKTTASLPKQRNEGAGQAIGEWLIFVDADSVLMPYFIDRIRVFIDRNCPSVFTTWAQPDSAKTVDAIFTLFANLIYEGSILFNRPFSPGPLTIVSRRVFDLIGGYNESRRYNEDVDFGLRINDRGVRFAILRESLYVWSMRRLRREGKMKVVQQYVVSALPILLFKRPIKYMPGYSMGGQLYGKKKKSITRKLISTYERKLKALMKEFLY